MTAQEAGDLLSIDEGKHIMRALISERGPAVRVDVIHHERYIFLRIRAHILPFWDEEADEFMVALRRAFLVRRGCIAIEYLRTGISVFVQLNGRRIGKLAAVVRETHNKELPEQLAGQSLIKAVEHIDDGCGIVAFAKESEHHLCLYEMDRQKTFASFFPLDCVEFNDRGVGMFIHVRGEVFESTSDPALLIHLDMNSLFAGAEAYFPLEVQVHGREDTCIDVAVDGAFAHHDLILVAGTYMVRGLLVFDKRRDQSVEEPNLFFREGNAGPALREQEFVSLVSGLGVIELFFQGAFDTFWAAVADIGRP